jgi:hypothetical protein
VKENIYLLSCIAAIGGMGVTHLCGIKGFGIIRTAPIAGEGVTFFTISASYVKNNLLQSSFYRNL